MMDTKVVDHLMEKGDPLVEPRRVDHWLYFTHRELAEELVKWALNAETETDYQVEKLSEPTPEIKRYGLQIYHESAVTLEAITAHTQALEEKARELGGEYDGWETMVLLPENTEKSE
jgi:regulator of RNase E activity RraB